MLTRFACLSAILTFLGACTDGFQRFAPPSNSISGRGAKVNPKILTTTPANGATISPVTTSTGTQIKVVFDMSMDPSNTPVVNTWVRDVGSDNSNVWYTVDNSGTTFTWSSTSYANDTLTIQLGWVRWPENNIIGFDFDNSTLVNLDGMPLDNSDKLSFTVGWNPGRYKVVPTGQEACYSYAVNGSPVSWRERVDCNRNSSDGDDPVGSQNFPAGQNGLIEPRNDTKGPALYGAMNAGSVYGRRFMKPENPMNMIAANCTGNSADSCYPYSVDNITTLVWRTCSQGQFYKYSSLGGDKCTPPSAADYTWGQAVNACASLNAANGGQGYGGRKDWRLPTVDELENLVDYGARSEATGTPGEPNAAAPAIPAIDGNKIDDYPYWEGAFPNTPLKGYWTATGVAALSGGVTYYGNAYIVEFKKGSVGAGGGSGSLTESTRVTTNRKKVRCVAGPSVAPAAQSFTPTVVAAGAFLGGKAANFSGFDNNATFNITAATPAYDIVAGTDSVTVNYNKAPNTAQAGNPANYCITTNLNAVTCAVSSPAISTALQVSGNANAYKLTLATAMGANTAYKIFVNSVNSASDQWQTGQSYTVNTYLSDSGDVYQVLLAHTSTNIPGDLGSGNIVMLAQFAPSTVYTANTKLYVPSLSQVVNVQTGYTSTASASNDITNGFLSVVKTLITTAPQALTLNKALFNGATRTAAPAAASVFNVTAATSPDTSTVKVTFNRLPDATQATTIGNYKIISAGSPTAFGSASVAAITGVTLSGYTATLATTLTAGTDYTVVVQGVLFSGSQVVDDTINKLRWQRCRMGTLDNATCADDGDSTNDMTYWNNGLNYCDSLNAIRFDDDPLTSSSQLYAWRAPTINELKSISNRSLFGTLGYSMDTTVFPTPNILAEDYASSTNYTFNGDPDPNGPNPPNYNQAWGFNYVAGFPSIAQRDNSTLVPLSKPPKKSIRCVRGLP